MDGIAELRDQFAFRHSGSTTSAIIALTKILLLFFFFFFFVFFFNSLVIKSNVCVLLFVGRPLLRRPSNSYY